MIRQGCAFGHLVADDRFTVEPYPDSFPDVLVLKWRDSVVEPDVETIQAGPRLQRKIRTGTNGVKVSGRDQVDDEPVAFCAVGPDGDLDHLYVSSAHTGAGLGGRLLTLAQERHPEGLALWVFASNTGAVRFYERQGFVVVGGTDGDNEEGAPDVLYVRG